MGTDVRGHFLPKSSVCLEQSCWISCKLVCFIFLNKQTLDSPVSFHLSEHLSWGYWVTVSQKQRIWDFLYKMQTFCKIQNDWNSLKRQVAKGWMFYAPILENVKKKLTENERGLYVMSESCIEKYQHRCLLIFSRQDFFVLIWFSLPKIISTLVLFSHISDF